MSKESHLHDYQQALVDSIEESPQAIELEKGLGKPEVPKLRLHWRWCQGSRIHVRLTKWTGKEFVDLTKPINIPTAEVFWIYLGGHSLSETVEKYKDYFLENVV